MVTFPSANEEKSTGTLHELPLTTALGFKVVEPSKMVNVTVLPSSASLVPLTVTEETSDILMISSPAMGLLIVSVGTVRSTVTLALADVAELPAKSSTSAVILTFPSARELKSTTILQAPPLIVAPGDNVVLPSKIVKLTVSPSSAPLVPLKVTEDTSELLIWSSPEIGLLNVNAGAVRSSVTFAFTEVAALPARSVTSAVMVTLPSAKEEKSTGTLHELPLTTEVGFKVVEPSKMVKVTVRPSSASLVPLIITEDASAEFT